MKNRILSFLIIGGLLLTSCSSNQKNVIAYGSEFDLNKYLELSEGESTDLSLVVDTKIVGEYLLKGNVLKDNKKIRELDEKVIVEDNDKPEIEVVQDSSKIYEIPYKDTYQVLGNVEKISDKVDGEYKEVQIVSEEEFKEIKKKLDTAKKGVDKQKFKTNEEIEKYKSEKEKCGYSILTSNVNTEVAGTYKIQILTSDLSFNTHEVSYQVKVLEEGKEAKKLAAGATGSKMGNGTSYQITDKTKVEEVPVNDSNEVATNDTNEVQNFESNIVSNNEVSAQGSPVLQAALNMVGSNMMCDDLVTMALVNGGAIWGTPNPIFNNGATYNIGVYQFPAIMQAISASQAVPGDLVFYDNGGYGSPHIAVYAGNGKAVHGGWSGRNVVVSTVNVGSGPRYFKFSPMSWNDVFKSIFGYDPESSGSDWTPPSGGDDSSQTPSVPDWDYGGYQYKSQISVGETTIAIGSDSPIDTDYFRSQADSYFYHEITYEQLVANLQANGYTMIDPF